MEMTYGGKRHTCTDFQIISVNTLPPRRGNTTTTTTTIPLIRAAKTLPKYSVKSGGRELSSGESEAMSAR